MNEKMQLLSFIREHKSDKKLVTRVTIVLKMLDGISKQYISDQLNISRPTINLWINRYKKGGIEELLINRYKNGHEHKVTNEKEYAIVAAALNTKPENAARWSIRSMAKAQNISRSAVYKIWKKYGITCQQGKLLVKNASNVSNKIKQHEILKLAGVPKSKKTFAQRRNDRTARLVQMQILLSQFPEGVTMNEIANKCSVNIRTAYRDMKALESALSIPIWESGNKRGIIEGHFIPPIHFTQREAINIFLALRLMQNYSHIYDSTIASTFIKLIVAVPPFLRIQVQNILNYMDGLPTDDVQIRNLDKLIEGWLSQHKVKIQYQGMPGKDINDVSEYIIQPYYIEPSVLGYSNHMIGYNELTKKISNFKLDQILGDVMILQDTYEIPTIFNISNFVSSPWDIYIDEKLTVIKLRFCPRWGKIVARTIWHPSQKVEMLEDGSAIITMRVRETKYLFGWILMWGIDVEVIEPDYLRTYLGQITQNISNIYIH